MRRSEELRVLWDRFSADDARRALRALEELEETADVRLLVLEALVVGYNLGRAGVPVDDPIFLEGDLRQALQLRLRDLERAAAWALESAALEAALRDRFGGMVLSLEPAEGAVTVDEVLAYLRGGE